jgi:hypothetical protein
MHHRNPLVLLLPLLLTLQCWVAVVSAAEPGGEPVMLDVGLVIFDPGIPEDKSTHSKLGIFPEIRKSEAKYMPVMLRRVLIESGSWGVVRVLPEPLESSELLVRGRIVHSDGQRLELHIQASDATGRGWLDKNYAAVTLAGDYPVTLDGDPYLGLYQQIAADLYSAREQQTQKRLQQIREVAFMRYAASLAPDAFSSYLGYSEEGVYTLSRLPAEGDPMIARVNSVRNQEYLFIDTVDEQYARLSEDMATTYHLWRQYDREQALFRTGYQQRVEGRDSRGRRGSYAAMEQTYNAYKWSKIHVQDLDELAQGFNNEVAPTVMEVSGQVFRLSGTLDNQYAEWRDILQRIFTLEMGLTP